MDTEEEVHQIQVGNESSWIDPFIEFLVDKTLLTNYVEAHRIKRLVAQYVLIDNRLYKRSTSLPLLKYLHPFEAEYAL